MANAKRKGLGKGLGALINSDAVGNASAPRSPRPASPTLAALADGAHLIELDPSTIKPNPKQPRRIFDEGALEELAASIRRDGVQEPVLVRKHGDDYELISGERRVRASIMADLAVIPAVCRDVSDRDMLKLGLIENIQREDLNAIEMAQGYQDLMDEFGWTQEQVAKEVGKKRATVTNMLRLLNLPEVVQEQVADGSISMGHARALLAFPTANAQMAIARKIVAQGLSVRQVEKLANEKKSARTTAEQPSRDPNIVQLEDELRQSLGTKVQLRNKAGGKGKIEIEYYNLDELERLLAILRG